MAAKPETNDNPFAVTNAIQVRIDENVRLLAELHAKWEREDEIARNISVSTITTTSVEASNSSTTFDDKVDLILMVATSLKLLSSYKSFLKFLKCVYIVLLL